MERTMSVEDKIRRAEERYYKRREQENSIKESRTKEKSNKKSIKILNKMIKQILICSIIYFAFYIIANNNYIFSEDFTNKIKEILNQDIDFKAIYSIVSSKIKENIEKIEKQEVLEVQEKQESEENVKNEENEENLEQQESNDSKNEEENIGGSTEEIVTQEKNTQMEQDANNIKNTISFIKPLEGKISSGFGIRNPTTATVPKNHTGTDIAAETGSKIISATDGKVILASSTGDYGKHLKIQINEVVLVYAHCNKLYVKEGEEIKQGQEIAEVGTTGNTTGPHLHFEIRYQDRYVDPEMVLNI